MGLTYYAKGAFDAIHAEFIRIGDDIYPDDPGTTIEVRSGKDYVRNEERVGGRKKINREIGKVVTNECSVHADLSARPG